MFVPDCYKNQQMSNKVIDNDSFVLEFVLNCFKKPKDAQ